MSITEYQRHELFNWFEEHMGKERATTMMNLVPPVGWGDVATSRDLELHRAATKADLEVLRADMHQDVQRLRQEMQDEFKAVRTEMNDGLSAVRTEMNDGLSAVRTEMNNSLKDVRTELASLRQDVSALGRTFAGWLFLSRAAVIGAVAALLAVN